MNALIKMKDGTSYLTPIDNLDNVKRMLAGQYNDIEFPDYVEEIEEDEESEELTEKELRAKYEEVFGKKAGNKSIATMKKDIEEQLSKATN